MANYYWLGVTGACGNVNNPINWTLWTPQGACGYLPPSALTGPGFNDTVYFTKFTVSGACYGVDYYPQVSPQGQMLGRTGTAIGQHFAMMRVFDDCPVSMGSADHYFKFNAASVLLSVGESNSQLTNATSYLDINKNDNITGYANVTVDAGKTHTYWLKGAIRNVNAISMSRSTRSIIHLKDCELTNPWETNITVIPWSTYTPYDIIYLYPSTIGYNGFMASGNVTFNIYNGFNMYQETYLKAYLYNYDSNYASTVNFIQAGYSGASGADLYTRSYINKIILSGTAKTSNVVNVNHAVDIVNLEIGAGTVNFNQAPDANSTIVQKGYMNASTAKITASNPTVTLGSNGDFLVQNTNTALYSPDISLAGTWDFYVNPASGYCGPNG